jgi:hypothetical protein
VSGSSDLGGVFSESDRVAHAFELFDELSFVGFFLRSLDEVLITVEFVLGLISLKGIIDDHEDRVRNCDDRLLFTATALNASVLRG